MPVLLNSFLSFTTGELLPDPLSLALLPTLAVSDKKIQTMLLLWERGNTQGAKKVIFTACHSGKLKLTFTSPNIISTSPKNVLMSRLISQFFCNLNSSKNFTCPSGKLKTEFTSPIAKSTSPRLSDTTFFACSNTSPFITLSTPWLTIVVCGQAILYMT